MTEVSTHIDLVLFGQLFCQDSHGNKDPMLTMCVVAHCGLDEKGPYDSPLGDAQTDLSAEAIFADDLGEILEILNEPDHLHHTMPILVKYTCAPDGTGISVSELRPVRPQTLEQMVCFAWGTEA